MNANPTSNSGAGLTPGYRYYRHGYHYIYVPCMACGFWWKHTVRHVRDCKGGVRHRFRQCLHVSEVVVMSEGFEPDWMMPISTGITAEYLMHSETRPRGNA